mmetsp:Transcript_7075/g.23429  ORF Transcript_7075/g.23429 Transcript_7075/m.23429 type:complete len:355 (+) Transcript_7075:70-1134(+)
MKRCLPTIPPGLQSTSSDGVPILHGSQRSGRRVRYTVAPLTQVADGEAAALPATADPPRRSLCPVCNNVMVDPVAPPCGHSFCSKCTQTLEHPEQGGKIECPTCARPALASSVRPSSMMSWLLGGVRVRCTAPGCGHESDRSSAGAHAAACPHVLVECPHASMGCAAKVARGSLAQHLAGCPFEACQSFMAATLRRLQALEADRDQLRSEVATLRNAVRWSEANQPMPCADCRMLFVPRADEEPEPAPPTAPRASAAPPPPCVPADAADPVTTFRPWPVRAGGGGTPAASREGAAAAAATIRAGCVAGGCCVHRRDEEWYADFRQRKIRFLREAASAKPPPGSRLRFEHQEPSL